MFNLLSLELDEQTSVVFWVSLAVAILLIGIIAILCISNKRLSTRALASSGVTLALSFVLLILGVPPVPNGGSITLASLLPVMVFAFFYGFTPALLTGIVLSIVYFLSAPYVLTPLTFFLDYILAFSCVAIVALFKNAIKNKTAALVVGISAAYGWRFPMHFISGIIYFDMGVICEGFPTDNAVIFSLAYNAAYLIPDYLIAAIAGAILSATKILDKLETYAHKK